MANLTNTETLDLPIDRQDLYNMWANATLGTIPQGDLAPGTFTTDIVDYLTGATSSPEPGHMVYATADRLAFMFHDEIDGTGVSLWLAIGPDRFDVACLANSPVPAGAVVQFTYDKWVGPSTGASARPTNQHAIGTCAAGISWLNTANLSTQASGTWIPVSIDGIVWGAAGGTTADNRWIRTQDGTFGLVERNGSGSPAPTDGDDVIGLGLQDIVASTTTPVATQFIWTGPRVINAFT